MVGRKIRQTDIQVQLYHIVFHGPNKEHHLVMRAQLQKRQSPPRFLLHNIRFDNRAITSHNPSAANNPIEPEHGLLDHKFHPELYSYS